MQQQWDHNPEISDLHPTEFCYPNDDIRHAKSRKLPLSKPGPADVLCGKGNGTKHHPGNVTYREVVARYKRRCVLAQKFDKPMYARQVVFDVRYHGGLFLKRGEPQKGEHPDLYYDIGDEAAIKKAAQALREGAEKLRKELFEKLETLDNVNKDEGAQVDDEIQKKDHMETISLIYPLFPNTIEHESRDLQTAPDISINPGLISTGRSFNSHALISRNLSQESVLLSNNEDYVKDGTSNYYNQEVSRGVFNEISASTLGDSSGKFFPVEDNARNSIMRNSPKNMFDSENTNNEKVNFPEDLNHDAVESSTNTPISRVPTKPNSETNYLIKSLKDIEENDETADILKEDFPMYFNHNLSFNKITDENDEGDLQVIIDNIEESTDVSTLIRERSTNSIFLNPLKRIRVGSICSSKMDALQLETPDGKSLHMCDIRNSSNIIDALHLEIPRQPSFRISDISRLSSNSLIRSHQSVGSMYNSINGYSNTAEIRKSVANLIATEQGKVKRAIGIEEYFGGNCFF